MPFFSSPTQTYYYEAIGHGPPLLLLHGFTGSSQGWAPIMDALSSSHRLIALDLPGHGRSEAPADPSAYAMPTVSREIIALLEHLECAGVHLLGYSMGGRLALYLAHHYPQRWLSLILESTSPGLPSAAERQARVASDEALADYIETQGIEAFVARWQALPLFASQKQLSPAVREAHRAARLRNRPRGLANSLRGMGTGVQPSLWPYLPTLSLPTLLIAGRLDQKFVAIARRMSTLIPRARLQIDPGAGHTVHLEQPAHYIERLRAWLDELA